MARSVVEENHDSILKNYHAAFRGNRNLANANTDDLFRNRFAILRAVFSSIPSSAAAAGIVTYGVIMFGVVMFGGLLSFPRSGVSLSFPRSGVGCCFQAQPVESAALTSR